LLHERRYVNSGLASGKEILRPEITSKGYAYSLRDDIGEQYDELLPPLVSTMNPYPRKYKTKESLTKGV